MGGLFKSKTPKVQPAPPPPTDNSAEVRDAAEAERVRTQMMRGRASTVLTGGEGDTSEAETAKKKLLGV